PLATQPAPAARLRCAFRCGFLGLLHLEIVRDRLQREFGLDLISTAPNVVYRVLMEDGTEHIVTNPSEFPSAKVAEVYEPVVRATLLAPSEYVGAIMELCQSRRGALLGMDYLSADRVEVRYTLPLAEIIFDFFDQLKSKTRGYASRDYEPMGYEGADLVRGGIRLHGGPGGGVARGRARDKGAHTARHVVGRLSGAHPPAAVRRGHPSRDRVPHRRPGD